MTKETPEKVISMGKETIAFPSTDDAQRIVELKKHNEELYSMYNESKRKNEELDALNYTLNRDNRILEEERKSLKETLNLYKDVAENNYKKTFTLTSFLIVAVAAVVILVIYIFLGVN